MRNGKRGLLWAGLISLFMIMCMGAECAVSEAESPSYLEIGDVVPVYHRNEIIIDVKLFAPGCWEGFSVSGEISPLEDIDRPAATFGIDRLSPETLSVIVNTPGLAPGGYACRAVLKNGRSGQVISSARKDFTFDRDMADWSRDLAIDRNNALVVDGKPFFPIMSWNPSINLFKELSEVGFNTMVGPFPSANDAFLPENLREYFWAARKTGMKVISPAVSYIWGPPPTVTCREPGAIVEKFKKEHLLIGWMTGDEVFANRTSVPQMYQLYRTIRQHDSVHPVYVDMHRAEVQFFRDTMSASDIVGFNWYPIPDAQISSYTELMGTMKKRVAGRKPIWVWLQLYLGKEKSRQPTPEELRCMTWLVIAQEAKGIGYFIYSSGIPQETKEALKKIISEVRELAPVILEGADAGAVPVRLTGGTGGPDILYREWQGKKYLFAVNADSKPVGIEFHPGRVSSDGDVNVLYESREIPMNGGVFKDSFPAFGVHIYVFR